MFVSSGETIPPLRRAGDRVLNAAVLGRGPQERLDGREHALVRDTFPRPVDEGRVDHAVKHASMSPLAPTHNGGWQSGEARGSRPGPGARAETHKVSSSAGPA
jgi:hypothetical protein